MKIPRFQVPTGDNQATTHVATLPRTRRDVKEQTGMGTRSRKRAPHLLLQPPEVVQVVKEGVGPYPNS